MDKAQLILKSHVQMCQTIFNVDMSHIRDTKKNSCPLLKTMIGIFQARINGGFQASQRLGSHDTVKVPDLWLTVLVPRLLFMLL